MCQGTGELQDLKLPHNRSGMGEGLATRNSTESKKAENSQASARWDCQRWEFTELHSGAPAPPASCCLGPRALISLALRPSADSTKALGSALPEHWFVVALSRHSCNSLAPLPNTNCPVSCLCLNSQEEEFNWLSFCQMGRFPGPVLGGGWEQFVETGCCRPTLLGDL